MGTVPKKVKKITDGKNLRKIFYSRTGSPMILKLGMQCWGFKLYNIYIIGDPRLTLTYFKARSNLVSCEFEWEKLLQSNQMGKLAVNVQINRRFAFFY